MSSGSDAVIVKEKVLTISKSRGVTTDSSPVVSLMLRLLSGKGSLSPLPLPLPLPLPVITEGILYNMEVNS